MTIKTFIRVGAIATLFAAGTAFAQVTSGSVTVTTSPVTSPVGSGSGVALGSVTLTGSTGAQMVTGIPITITPGGGAAASYLSNCQLFNTAGASVTTGSNVVNTIGSGSNQFTLNNSVSIQGTTSPMTFNIRCDISSANPSTGTFVISAGAASLAPALWVSVDAAPSVPAGSQDVALANIMLTATNPGSSINVSSLPITVTPGNFGATANLTDCRIHSTVNLNVPLTNAISLGSGAETGFPFLAPYPVFTGLPQQFALTCDVSGAAAVGSTYTISVDPARVPAVNAATGGTISPVAGGMTSGTVIVSAAVPGGGTGNGGTGNGGTGGTPGVPNTGAGGDLIQVLYVLIVSGLIALSGYAYLRSRES